MWKELNIKDSQVNMSKVIPYDSELNLLNGKEAYYHNGRLTALQKYKTDEAIGYKAYKRKANSNHLIDGENTDYIELYKVLESGATSKILEFSTTYYAVEEMTVSGNGLSPEFINGVIVNNTLIGSYSDWAGYTFKSVYIHNKLFYFAIHQTTKVVKILTLYFKKTNNLEENRSVVTVGNADTDVFFTLGDDDFLYIANKNNLDSLISNFSTKTISGYDYYGASTYKPYDEYVNKAIEDFTKSLNVFELNLDNIKLSNSKTLKLEIKSAETSPGGENLTIKNSNGKIVYEKSPTAKRTRFILTLDTKQIVYFAFEYSIITINKTALLGSYFCYLNLNGYVNDGNFYIDSFTQRESTVQVLKSCTFRCGLNFSFKYGSFNDDTSLLDFSVLPNGLYIKADVSLSDGIYINKNETAGGSYAYGFYVNPQTIRNIYSTNYQNDSVFLDYNNFILNFAYKQPVSIGHRYKTICRLDQNADDRFIKADATGVYVSYAGKNYKISLKKMFAEYNYDSEVNVIDSDYMWTTGAYKIFNTTSYYNAIYNDSKTLCSCDDWNGRYKTKTLEGTTEALLYQHTSRVNPFWRTEAQSNVPVKAISDELLPNSNNLDFANPIYEWTNPSYTIHSDTEAIIFKQTSTTDTNLYEYKIATSNGFVNAGGGRYFVESTEGYQIVPSILFTNYIQSSGTSPFIQINGNAYPLLSYSNSYPALVINVVDVANITVSPDDYSFVIQGAFYSVISSEGVIKNPFDTNIGGVQTYCCDVKGLQYIGYDSTQAYFYSSSTGVIYTFNGANKLNAWLELDKRTPLKAGKIDDGHKVGIGVCNIPSMNIISMAFTDGALIIVNGQAIFVNVQTVNNMSINADYGMIKINGYYYFFDTNLKSQNIIIQGDVLSDTNLEKKLTLSTCKLGLDRLTNQTVDKHRIAIYNDTSKTSEMIITVTSRQGDKIQNETFTKIVTANQFIDNEFMFEWTPKITKANWFIVKVELKNADLLNYYFNVSDKNEEYLVR